jgi:hypothetical protein
LTFLNSEQKISQPFLFIACLFVACLLISNIIAGSTVVGEGFDTLLFITIAFAGMLPAAVLFEMMLAQYCWKVGYEIMVTPLTYLLVSWLKKREGLDTYDQDIDYNPFRLEVTGNEPH